MNHQESWFEKHERFTWLMIISIIVCGILLPTIFVLIPEKTKELAELHNMDCSTIKKHLADEDFGWMLDESRFNAQYIWRCTK